jgi:hypothetical protein
MPGAGRTGADWEVSSVIMRRPRKIISDMTMLIMALAEKRTLVLVVFGSVER